ncbi:DNA-binding transcriptional regulator YhcF (GntR family) [Kibdelosporangium banguiense]|uniref:DNA-binding transcriptional regulator YhcF (GntR family) n=1 Tax=Kibdelosporangium banguiense TaxID=1365924 RepID=A0ABS4TUH9_9PSEU|nr:TetR/AcrR family transcriptional regulator C-terminal domain-containing protein [Kibdelosporangium banguiense]MBP2327609.1 DNA-binding transcriptional regulator YhcF (GntR family) [Kibdelosporangium banguiense]
MEPPYARIVTEIRRRIDAGELKPGERVPSTRQICQEWGVALATATKALTALSQSGDVTAVPRVGTIVAERADRPREAPDQRLTAAEIIRAAIDIADAEGLPAVSMRGVAARLKVGPMSLYRYVHNKDDLILMMIDTAWGETALPAAPPDGWRARFETAARLQWTLHRRHPWLARAMPLSRPLLLGNMLAHAEWMFQAMARLGLSAETMMDVHITMYSYVQGLAVNLDAEAEAQADTGQTQEEWTDGRAALFQEVVASGAFPAFTDVMARLEGAGYDFSYDALFEFGLRHLLDGLAAGVLRDA